MSNSLVSQWRSYRTCWFSPRTITTTRSCIWRRLYIFVSIYSHWLGGYPPGLGKHWSWCTQILIADIMSRALYQIHGLCTFARLLWGCSYNVVVYNAVMWLSKGCGFGLVSAFGESFEIIHAASHLPSAWPRAHGYVPAHLTLIPIAAITTVPVSTVYNIW